MRKEAQLIVSLISSLSLIATCSSVFENSRIGLYGECDNGYLACWQIQLNEDSTFVTYSYSDVGGSWSVSEGNYAFVHDTLTLNSYEQPKPPEVTYSLDNKLVTPEQVQIQVFDFDGYPQCFARLFVNGQAEGHLLDDSGSVVLNSRWIETIKFNSLFFEEVISLEKVDARKITIKVENSIRLRDYITNWRFVYKRGSLFPLQVDGKISRKVRIKRTSQSNLKYKS